MTHFSTPENATLVRDLEQPDDPVRLVIDTDAFNEIDDQYAVSFALLAPNLTVEALYAAPFHNKRSNGPEDGMEKSFDEIRRLLALLADRAGTDDVPVLKGSRRYLDDSKDPVLSEAAEDLVRRAMMPDRRGKLYVVSIGAPTNVASALLMEPKIRDSIVVVWLGGQPHEWHTAWEFNLKQDRTASSILFDSGVPLVHVPCKNVAEHLRVTVPELDHYLRGKNRLSDYLFEITARIMEQEGMRSRVVWDVAPVAWLRQRGLVLTHLAPSPILSDEFTWSIDPSRHLIAVAYDVDRDAILRDLFDLLAGE